MQQQAIQATGSEPEPLTPGLSAVEASSPSTEQTTTLPTPAPRAWTGNALRPANPDPSTSSTQSIELPALELALSAAKLRRLNNGRTAQFCALTPAPTIQADCRLNGPWSRAGLVEASKKSGLGRAGLWPMQRGHIAKLYEHVRRTGGLAEVRATWGTGIKALRAEPRYVLSGGVL